MHGQSTHYEPWVGPDEAENTSLRSQSPPLQGPLTVCSTLSVTPSTTPSAPAPEVFEFVQDHNGNRRHRRPHLLPTSARWTPRGVDFGLQYFITRALGLQASYSWFDYEVDRRERSLRGVHLERFASGPAGLSGNRSQQPPPAQLARAQGEPGSLLCARTAGAGSALRTVGRRLSVVHGGLRGRRADGVRSGRLSQEGEFGRLHHRSTST